MSLLVQPKGMAHGRLFMATDPQEKILVEAAKRIIDSKLRPLIVSRALDLEGCPQSLRFSRTHCASQ